MYFSQALERAVLSCAFLTSLRSCALASNNEEPVKSTTCNAKTYVYEELAGYGNLPSNARDIKGDTLGGIGSSIAMDKSSWRREGKSYKGLSRQRLEYRRHSTLRERSSQDRNHVHTERDCYCFGTFWTEYPDEVLGFHPLQGSKWNLYMRSGRQCSRPISRVRGYSIQRSKCELHRQWVRRKRLRRYVCLVRQRRPLPWSKWHVLG